MKDRRVVLKNMLAGVAGLALPRLSFAANLPGVQKLSDKISLIDADGCNVLAFEGTDGLVLVDSGPNSKTLMNTLNEMSEKSVKLLFNTHYHADQIGSNEEIGKGGATIIAHKKTALHLATDYYLPQEERYQRALPKVAQPNQTFYTHDSVQVDDEKIDYGYLIQAHTDGDIYVHFRQANIIAVGDVVSPEKDPSLDWYAGGWLGGRVDAMDTLLSLSDENTLLVPSYGPVLTREHLQAERDLMAFLYERMNVLVRDGYSAKLMLEEGLMEGLVRTWDEPYKFLYAGHKGMWAHHTKLANNIL